VIGAGEEGLRAVNIRNRDDESTHAKGNLIPLDEALDQLVRLRDQRTLESLVDFSQGVWGGCRGPSQPCLCHQARWQEMLRLITDKS
jgi:threonyl-tRNA synthetase